MGIRTWSVTATVSLAILATIHLGGCGGDGLHCWDLDGDGEFDEDEDLDGDGEATALDCRGPGGAQGPDGNPGEDGEDGEDGEIGAAGADGLACWDLDGDGVFDPEEDVDGSGVATTGDCQPAGSIDKSHLRMTAAAAWCAVHVASYASAAAVEFPETGAPLSGDVVCQDYTPEPADTTCYNVIIMHNTGVYEDPMHWIYNGPRDCAEEIQVSPGTWPFACCDN